MNDDINAANQINFKISTLEHKLEQLQLKYADEGCAPIIAKTKNGKIKGTKRCTIYNDVYYSFERIPYAQPPVGELRFRAPKLANTWKNIRDCTHYGIKPMQRNFITKCIEGTEDCLYLNVYTNSITPMKSRPVMVWIYSSNFACGEATREWFGPDYFMKRDIILITVQYRLGALGFLSLSNKHLHIPPGNAGLKDQIMALQWIKRNCTTFGGNPQCITVFGDASVTCLMLSDQAKGLFHRVIGQAGVITADNVVRDTNLYTLALAQAAGYTGASDERAILKFLLSCTAADIIEAEAKCQYTFGPTVESYITQHTVLHKSPADMLEHSWGNALPLLIGGNSNEGLFYAPSKSCFTSALKESLRTCTAFVPKEAAPFRESLECRAKGLRLRELHVAGNTPTVEDYREIISYAYIWHPVQIYINARLKYAKHASTYLYRFDFVSKRLMHPLTLLHGRNCNNDDTTTATTTTMTTSGGIGAAHAAELSYLFHNILSQRMERQSHEYRNIKLMIDLWTTFAETGNPNSRKINGMKGIKWQPLRNADTKWKCLNIGNELKFMILPELTKLSVWQQLCTLHRQQLPKSNEFIDLDVYAKSML